MSRMTVGCEDAHRHCMGRLKGNVQGPSLLLWSGCDPCPGGVGPGDTAWQGRPEVAYHLWGSWNVTGRVDTGEGEPNR
ncbi:hypothetical protein BDW02DRAFT_136118 [Decorospora gaudefroyi]|uniref:Uncharacterized protein n=1 Tax=Decorospora gaudefroyi TaxID=184978 RepID=A0A6A5JZH9_9PLEO|nr:hypothetical protein BDW02DRAFT_136118 [Decorospora gaudefroyi]